ncbi:serine/threonine-protein kinase [Hamadaea flava]|uniref:non-specific serine/threonine protein kinase n=1 Tax=Hamadaea flava TaxID=1742688 RepID=A0ABV8M1X4_9ACTN|nr:serine/threonine-protein kinase [Hamadaea flava]MCP2329021.1 serine/threonine-protein kinase [Hamadaea flava]
MTGVPEEIFEAGDLLEDRYRLIEPIASGGTATVWRARDERLGRVVAVKALDRKLLSDPMSRARLGAEARVLARLSHPSIAVIHDYGVAVSTRTGQPVPFLVMEVVDGVPLADLLAGRPLPWGSAVTVAARMAEALAAAHSRGVVHRDVSPRNVLLTADDVKVIDFGISAFQDEPGGEPGAEVVGTPAYTAPERLDGAPVHPSADVYAVGVMLYLMLAGRLPWRPASLLELLSAHRNLAPEPLPEIDGLPESVAQACHACLAKNPADRPSAADLARILGEAAPVDGLTLLDTYPTRESSETVTRVLAWPTLVVAGSSRRSARAVVGSVAAIAVVALVWLAAARLPAVGPQAAGTPEWTNTPAPPACQVTYQVLGDTGERFTAAVTVTNTGPDPVRDWRLTFQLPGRQQVDEALAQWWEQDGTTVSSRVQTQALAAGGTAKLSVTGRYTGGNQLPVAFTLRDADAVASCVPTVLGVVAPMVTPSQTSAPSSEGSSVAANGNGKGSHGNRGKGRG